MDITTQLDDVIALDEQQKVLEIFQKNGEPYTAADGSPATITVVGQESKQYRRAGDAITRRMLRSRKDKLEPRDLEANRIDQAAAAVVAWHGWEHGSIPAPCTPDNIRSVLRAAHILDQVEAGIRAHADFFGAPSSS